ncbi:MAG: PEP-CTERM sorting domain-containing protein [Aquabacterium sp.]|nr:MAG: PEP-CTERM sorting domain-containing protein [Aquabacterium sp.]
MNIMTSRRVFAAVAAAAAVFASPAAQAVAVNGGPYFAALNVTDLNKGAVTVEGPQLSWTCAGSACTFSGALRTSVVFEAAGTADHALLSIPMLFAVVAEPVALLDPLGQTVGYYQADLGKWHFDAVVDNAAAPTESIFMTAYGHNEVSLEIGGQSYHALELMSGGHPSTASIGPGSSSAAGPAAFFTSLSASAVSPYYAFPSKTDPRCTSFSCLEFGAGKINSVRYALSFDLVAVSAPVPEPGTLWMLLIGLGLSAACASRRVR